MAMVTVTPKPKEKAFLQGDLIIDARVNQLILVTAVNESLSINGVVIQDDSNKQPLGTGRWIANHETSQCELFEGTVTLEQ